MMYTLTNIFPQSKNNSSVVSVADSTATISNKPPFIINTSVYDKTLENAFITQIRNLVSKPEEPKEDDIDAIIQKIKNNKKWANFKRFSVCIIVGSVLILTLCVIKLWLDPISKDSNDKELLCNTTECHATITRLLVNIDKNVNPCDDFYQFSCGNWIEEHKRHLNSYQLNSFNRFKELSRHNFKILFRILVNKTQRNHDCDIRHSALCKMNKYLDVCLSDSLNKTDTTIFDAEIKKFLRKLGGWPLISGTFKTEKWDLTDSLVFLQFYKIHPLFITSVISDPQNSSINRILFAENRMKLISDHSGGNFLKKFVHFLANLVKLLQPGKEANLHVVHKYGKAVYLFERKLLKIFKRVVRSGMSKSSLLLESHQLYSFKKLNELVSCKSSHGVNGETVLNIEKYLFEMLKNNMHIYDFKYFVSIPSYFRQLCTLLLKTEKTVLAAYVGLYALQDLLPYMPLDYRLLNEEFFESVLRRKKRELGAKLTKSSMNSCVKQTDEAFGYATGALFLSYKNLSDSYIDEIQNITMSLKEAFIENVPNIEWMDAKTKERAIYKAKHMNVNIGYPKWMRNKTRLNEYYNSVAVSDSSFTNILNIRGFHRAQSLESILTTNRIDWSMAPLEVNAYYTQSKNTIGFPIGILWDPFYNQHALRALNYGGLGMVIGHEITHAFDATGRNYDTFGNLNNWWANESALHFKRKSECFKKQYSNYMISKNKALNGLLTLDENIADNGGIKLAFEAYKKYLNKAQQRSDVKATATKLTPEKLFFISFAQAFCSLSNRKYAEESLSVDPHSFSKYRVIGALTNSIEFSNTFNCPLKSPMNPPEKCTMW